MKHKWTNRTKLGRGNGNSVILLFSFKKFEIVHKKGRGQVNAIVIEYFNNILFPKSAPIKKQHTNQSINQSNNCEKSVLFRICQILIPVWKWLILMVILAFHFIWLIWIVLWAIGYYGENIWLLWWWRQYYPDSQSMVICLERHVSCIRPTRRVNINEVEQGSMHKPPSAWRTPRKTLSIDRRKAMRPSINLLVI